MRDRRIRILSLLSVLGAGTDRTTYDHVPETGRPYGILVGTTRIIIERGKHARQPDIER